MDNNIPGYRGSNTLKKANVPIEWSPSLLQEFLKCSQDPIYFAESYIQIVNIDRGLIPIELYDYQKEIILSIHNHRYTVAELSRQLGKTVSICCYVLWYIIFNPNKTVAILANKAETAREILSRIQLAYEHLPSWLQQGVIEWNKGSFVLENGSRVLAAATSSNNIRGYSCNLLVIDEAAFISGWDDFFTSVFPTISSGDTSKLVLISTVNGLNHFYKITSLARQKKNNFNLISADWTARPGRTDMWKEETLAAMNYDYDKFAQEHCVSGDTMISLRDTKTNEIINISIENAYKLMENCDDCSIQINTC